MNQSRIDLLTIWARLAGLIEKLAYCQAKCGKRAVYVEEGSPWGLCGEHHSEQGAGEKYGIGSMYKRLDAEFVENVERGLEEVEHALGWRSR